MEHFVRQTVQIHGADASEDAYTNTFRCVDARLPTAPRATPRAPHPRRYSSPHHVEPNADGNIGESANIDPDGRYTVKSYFDAGEVTGRPRNSHPVRMIQAHAGPSYSVHFPLKPGVEVLLVFMDGDPDRPLIVGSVPGRSPPLRRAGGQSHEPDRDSVGPHHRDAKRRPTLSK
ncbi:MAG: DUF6484 domain-containing protein [Polyangiaceae bacterium]